MSLTDQTATRRRFLAGAALGALATAAIPSLLSAADQPASRPASADDVAFFLVSDTHYLADKADPSKLDERSAVVTARLIDTLNALPGTAIPESAGGGVVATPRGVIHSGDLIDTGDKNGEVQSKMQATEWAAYARDYGLTGTDGRLKFPVYEVHGNHDGPAGKGLVIDHIIERNQRRVGVVGVSASGLHYAWDWGPVHCACLGIVVGDVKSVTRRRRYAPLDSLPFLIEDLKTKVGDSGRPVVIVHHVDVARYSLPCDPAATYDNKEWDPCDVAAFHAAMKPYNVAAILYGHTHVRNVFRWDGTMSRGAPNGIEVFNTDNAAHFASDAQALLYFEFKAGRMTVREYATKDRWETAAWSPTVWAKPLASTAAPVRG